MVLTCHMGTILRNATRKQESLNVITFPTHERTQCNMAGVDATFYMIQAEGVKGWNRQYAELPANHILLNPAKGDHQLPPEVSFDIVLSQNKWGQWPIAHRLAKALGLPLVSIEHTLPVPEWPPSQLKACRQMSGDINVFISEFSRKAWWFGDDPKSVVIHHGIDTGLFKPGQAKREHVCLSIVNDWINRDGPCGYRLWREVVGTGTTVGGGLPAKVLGDTPGLSKPAKGVNELVNAYQTSQVFLNTSQYSPIPTVVLEAMACGCPVVSTANCMLPEVIEHGVNGFLSNDPAELRQYCQTLLKNHELARRMGEAARDTIKRKFALRAFVENWNRVFDAAVGR